MKVKAILAFSQVPSKSGVWAVVTSPRFYPEAERATFEALGDAEFISHFGGKIIKSGKDVIFENPRGDVDPLTQHKDDILPLLYEGRRFIVVGAFPGGLSPDAKTKFSTILFRVDYFDFFELTREKYPGEFEANSAAFVRRVEEKLIPLLPRIPPEVWANLIDDCPNLEALEAKLREYGSGPKPKLPKMAFGFHQVWIPGLMASVLNLGRKGKALEGLMVEPLAKALRQRRKGEILYLNLADIPGADTTAAELAAIYVNDYYDGHVVEVDLGKLGPADLDFSPGSVLQKLLQGAIGENRKIENPAAVWITGAKTRKEVEEVVEKLAAVFNVAVVFYNSTHEEKIKKERSIPMNDTEKVLRWVLRIFYIFLFLVDITSNLIGIPKPRDFLGSLAWFGIGTTLSTIEYPMLWFYVPFCVFWWKKRPSNFGDAQVKSPVKNWVAWSAVAAILALLGLAVLWAYIINFQFSVKGATTVFLGDIAIAQTIDPESRGTLSSLALMIALFLNGFEIVGVLGDFYWGEFKQFIEHFSNGNNDALPVADAQAALIRHETISLEKEPDDSDEAEIQVTWLKIPDRDDGRKCSWNRCGNAVPGGQEYAKLSPVGVRPNGLKPKLVIPCSQHRSLVKEDPVEVFFSKSWHDYAKK